MSLFEYIVVFLGFYIAVSSVNLIRDSVKAIQANTDTVTSYPYLFIITVISFTHFQLWAGLTNDFHLFEQDVHILRFILVLASPIVLLITSEMISPDTGHLNSTSVSTTNVDSNETDLESKGFSLQQHYWANSRNLYLSITIFIFTAILSDFVYIFVDGIDFDLDAMIIRGVGIVLVLSLAKFNKQESHRTFHIIGTGLCLIAIIAFALIVTPYIKEFPEQVCQVSLKIGKLVQICL